MVLADLGRRLNQAFSDLQRQPVVDEASIDALLKHVCNALLGSDVNVQLVQSLRQNVKTDVRELLNTKGDALTDAQRKNHVQRVMFDHLVKLVDPGESTTTHRLEKGKQNVIMYAGLLTAGSSGCRALVRPRRVPNSHCGTKSAVTKWASCVQTPSVRVHLTS